MSSPTTVDKSVRMMSFLKDYVQLRGRVVKDVESYQKDGALKWFAAMPRTTGCASPAWHGTVDDGAWLQVKKQQLPEPPEVPVLLKEWLEGTDDAAGEPTLKQTIYRATGTPEGADLVPHALDDHPDVLAAWPVFLEAWTTWAEEYRRRADIRRLYLDLFKVYEAVSDRPEELELIVGLGLYVDPAAGVRRHVVEVKAQLVFDKAHGLLTLTGADSAVGDDLKLEDEFLDQKPSLHHYTDVRNDLAEVGSAIWNNLDLEQALVSWANALGDVDYDGGLAAPGAEKPNPTLTFAPALILRKRNIQGQVKMLETMIEHCSTSADVPRGIERLVESGDTNSLPGWSSPHQSSPGQARGGGQLDELYFPLPSNDAQARIVRRLSGQHGVIVQGPPGTGKSHTIANLICHLLATGKRVLVTSETPKALAVLKAKLPPELKALCVSAVSERDTGSELNTAVNHMVARHAGYDASAQATLLKNLEAELDRCRRRAAAAYKQLLELREAETYSVTLPGGTYSGTATAIARRVGADETAYGWLREVSLLQDDPPLDAHEVAELVALLTAYSGDEGREFQLAVPDPADLLPEDPFRDLVQAEATASAAWAAFREVHDDPRLQRLVQAGPEPRAALTRAAGAVARTWHEVTTRSEPWLPRMLADVAAQRLAQWTMLRADTAALLNDNQLAGEAKIGDTAEVSLPPDKVEAAVLADATAVWRFLKQGGSWNILGLFPSGPVKKRTYLRSSVRVNGKPADTESSLDLLITYLTAKRKLDAIGAQWKHVTSASRGTLQRRLAELQDNLTATTLVWRLKEESETLSFALQAVGLPALDGLPDEDETKSLVRLVEAAAVQTQLSQHRAALEQLRHRAAVVAERADAHPLAARLVAAVTERDIAAFREVGEQLGDFVTQRARVERLSSLVARLDASAPDLTTRAGDDGPATALQRLSELEAAWRWGQARAWLVERQEPGLLARVGASYQSAKADEAAVLTTLAAEKAWHHFMARLSDEQRKRLMAWKNAVGKIPKTKTAKSYPLYVRAAKEHMEACIPAVPAWIIPRYRLAETLSVAPEMFDVVIVDEASQTGIDGLTLPFIAKQVVVVGDDKQISPSGVGIKHEDVAALQTKYLGDNAYKAMFTPSHSLYDHATVHYGERIPLQEHFRCVPEIIEFSNQLCYAPDGIPLVPLRNYPPDRLDPVRTTYVEAGYQRESGQKVQNPPEAEALVEQIATCLADPRYDGKSFGVISLLGGAQADLLRDLLLERLGPETVEARGIVCGDAYAFQGDERDVIFLSMVSAPTEGKAIRALTLTADAQRFNVAASRAKDQMWLFHSALPEHLSQHPGCVRRRLLEYALNPATFQLTANGVDLLALRQAAHAKPRAAAAPKPFDSWFEVDVFLDLAERGFQVLPQVGFAGYRIDLVVEGKLGRLAVECDGDYWHGPDQFERDMARQRQLERAGWQFWRIRSSEYYFNRAEVMHGLWDELARRKITPTGRVGGDADTSDARNIDEAFEAVEVSQVFAGAQLADTENPDEMPDSTVLDNPAVPAVAIPEPGQPQVDSAEPEPDEQRARLLLALLETDNLDWSVITARFAEGYGGVGPDPQQRKLRREARRLEQAGLLKIERVKVQGVFLWGLVRRARDKDAPSEPPSPDLEPGLPAPVARRFTGSTQLEGALTVGSQETVLAEGRYDSAPDVWAGSSAAAEALVDEVLKRVAKKGAVDVAKLHKRLVEKAEYPESLEERSLLFEHVLEDLISSQRLSVALPTTPPDLMGATVYVPGLIDSVQNVPSSTWFGLAGWAKQNGHFKPWERRIVFTVGQYLQTVTPKQAAHAQRVYLQALELGYPGDAGQLSKTLN